MKNACVRCRKTKQVQENKWSYHFQNFKLYFNKYKSRFHAEDRFKTNKIMYHFYIRSLEKRGFVKMIETYKIDYQYSIKNMKSKIQLQDIQNIGLVLYYDNPNLYNLPLEEQRKKLIDELNSYGFAFSYHDLGIDKLRTLYDKKEAFSINQNG